MFERAHFLEALASIQPSALREVFVERPNIHWEISAALKGSRPN